jgi:DNA-binding transcriptional MerR regulator
MPEQHWKVGELAARTGLTVRTLHHYDAIGLLSPSGRTGSAHGSGHRLYTAADVARLHQIICLKQLGFSLEQVKEYMTRADYDPRAVVRLHLAKVRQQAAELVELGDRLEALATVLDAADPVSPDTFLETIEVMTMIEKYYTPEQLEQLKQRKEQVSDARIREVEAEWPRLHAEVRAAMAAGTDPADPKVQDMARRWVGLVNEFTGGDPGIFKSLSTMYQNEDNIMGMNVPEIRTMMEYVQKAMAAAGIKFAGQ